MRRPDWEARLAEYLAGAMTYARDGELEHCAFFAAGAARAVTGRDPMKGLRRRAQTGTGRVRILAEHGGLEAMVDDRFPAISPFKAKRGDLVMGEASDGTAAIGVCIGGEALFVGEEDGPTLVREPRSRWIKAWAV
ncbi:hypothetical protein ABC347_07745 [Sphingomonas sp. 1P06PA]|uniref:DUF6950 family protein n=1 Tax=Sphingomonas sp. 1P06PA TaxID=554121 RepID=UPI0039A6597C